LTHENIGQSNFINDTEFTFKDNPLAYIADSFRNDFDKQMLFMVIEQKLSKNLTFKRIFNKFKFENENIKSDNTSYKVPEFLNKIPNHYYINGILSTYDYNCKVNNNCTYYAILLLTVNGIPKLHHIRR
jgi:hypothetical protein